jgi:hypothetical protein
MGKRKAKEINPKQEVATVDPIRAVAERVTVQPVGLVDQGLSVSEIQGLPEEFKKGETLSGFPPSPSWEKPGETIFGDFIIMRPDVGPNNSRLYELAAFQGAEKDPLTVAVWGSAALDRLFDSAYPPIQTGDKLAIIFLGEKETKRGLNPVKLFALKVVRPSGKKTSLHAS